MSMFDYVRFLGSTSAKVVCAAGHPQWEAQTKDLEGQMAHYKVYDDQVYADKDVVDLDLDDPNVRTVYSVEDDRLVVVTDVRYPKADHVHGSVCVYTSCDACEPVFHEEGHHTWGGGLGSAKPWCEWVLTFEHGKLVNVEPTRCETRDDVRVKLGASGCIPLPDDDRVVKKELGKWREAHKRPL